MESWQKIPNGCHKYSDCFTCPFDDCCISQNALRGTNELIQQRNNSLKEMFKQGKSVKESAKKYGISERYARHIRALTNST